MNILTQKQIDRFWGKVDKEKSNTFYNGTRCWEWTAYCNSQGYGTIRIGVEMEKAHRVAWIIANGEILDNLQVLHHCDNPSCCNPIHCFLGTNQDNVNDKMSKGRGNIIIARNYLLLHPEFLARGDRSGARLHPEKLVRGEDHHEAKLTWTQVREIRRRYAPWGVGGDSSLTLAKEFEVTHTTIQDIVKNKRWKE